MTMGKREHGASLLGILLVLIVAGFFVLLGLRLIPVYMDYWTVVSIAESVEEDPEMREASPRSVRSALTSRMTLNNIDRDRLDMYTVERGEDGGLVIEIDYERREPLIANIDLVVHFAKTVGS